MKKTSTRNKVKQVEPKKAVDAYIAAFPKEAQVMLKQLRRIIKTTAPQAEEKMSYGIVGYFLKGRLVYFGGFKKHVSFFGWRTGKTPTKELQKYQTSKGTLQFPIGTKIPASLVKKLTQEAVRANAARKKPARYGA